MSLNFRSFLNFLPFYLFFFLINFRLASYICKKYNLIYQTKELQKVNTKCSNTKKKNIETKMHIINVLVTYKKYNITN